MIYMMLAAAAAAQVAAAEPYAFKSAQLGMSLEDFRSLPKEEGFGGPTMCTGDPEAAIRVPVVGVNHAGLKAAGVVKCVYYYTATSPTGFSHVNGIGVGSGGTEDYSFNFATDPKDGVTRLYEIALVVHARLEPEVAAILKAKYGAPLGSTAIAKQNGFGATIPAKATVWRNKVSTVGVERPFRDVNHAAVVYRLTRLYQIVAKHEQNPPVDTSRM